MENKSTVYYPVRKLRQPKPMSCWAAALTILYSWKNHDDNIRIEDVVKKYGELFYIIFESDMGISEKDEENLYKAAKLAVIEQENPTIKRWEELLTRFGPLSITVAIKITAKQKQYRNIHAIVVNGITTGSNSDKTVISWVDPADGEQYSRTFSEFITLYEGASNWPAQIIHWP